MSERNTLAWHTIVQVTLAGRPTAASEEEEEVDEDEEEEDRERESGQSELVRNGVRLGSGWDEPTSG